MLQQTKKLEDFEDDKMKRNSHPDESLLSKSLEGRSGCTSSSNHWIRMSSLQNSNINNSHVQHSRNPQLDIRYSGYLYKRSNQPYQEPTKQELKKKHGIDPSTESSSSSSSSLSSSFIRNINILSSTPLPSDTKSASTNTNTNTNSTAPFTESPLITSILPIHVDSNPVSLQTSHTTQENHWYTHTLSAVELTSTFFGCTLPNEILTDEGDLKQTFDSCSESSSTFILSSSLSSPSPLPPPPSSSSLSPSPSWVIQQEKTVLSRNHRKQDPREAEKEGKSITRSKPISIQRTVVHSTSRQNVIDPTHYLSPTPTHPSDPSHPPNETDSKHPDFIDPKDGHIWRAKYCVLEDGILYFYNNSLDGNSLEAQEERIRGSHSVLGTLPTPTPLFHKNGNHNNNSNDPTNQTLKHKKYSKSINYQELDALGKSPMPRPSQLQLCLEGEMNEDIDQPHVIWEKRVRLDMVGTVRAAEMDYGERSFELLAIRSDEYNNHALGQDYENLALDDRLILRASTLEEMNEWMFQFHRSLASLMKQFVCTFENEKSTDLISGKFLATSLIPKTNIFFENHPKYHPISRHTSNISPIILHSPIKNGFHRRRSRGDSDCTPEAHPCEGENQSISSWCHHDISDETVGQTDNDTKTQNLFHSQGLHPGINSSITASGLQAITIPHVTRQEYITLPRDATISDDIKPTKSAKYVPPHLRKKVVQLESTQTVELHVVKNAAADTTIDISMESLIVHSTIQLDDQNNSGEYEAMAILTTDNSSLSQPDDCPRNQSKVKLGGCADPYIVSGSILDQRFIPRDASKVGKGQSEHSTHRPVGRSTFGTMWEIGAVSDCGIRDWNEDAFVIINDLRDIAQSTTTLSEGIGLFAIFDGHCGNHTARYASERLPTIILEKCTNINDTYLTMEEKLKHILCRSIDTLDEEFCTLCTAGGRDWDSGATAIIALVLEDTVAVATLGDSNGVYSYSVPAARFKNSENFSVLEPNEDDAHRFIDNVVLWREVADVHSPSRHDEKQRIESANGWITSEQEIRIASQLSRIDFFDEDVLEILKRCFSERFDDKYNAKKSHAREPGRILHISRLCGELAVSRALGDRDFKAAFNAGVPAETSISFDSSTLEWESALFLPYPDNHSRRFVGDLVSSIPDVSFFKVGKSSDEFLILACDGLWDVMDCDDAVRITKDLIFQRGWTAMKTASRLVELAIHLGSSDNVTVIVVRFYQNDVASII